MGGMGGLGEMLSNMGGMEEMLSNMGGENGINLNKIMKSMNNKRKDANTNVNSNNVDASEMTLHEKMKNRMLVKKLKDFEKQLTIQKQTEDSLKNYVPYDFGEDTKNIFKIDGEVGVQETSLVSAGPKKDKKKEI